MKKLPLGTILGHKSFRGTAKIVDYPVLEFRDKGARYIIQDTRYTYFADETLKILPELGLSDKDALVLRILFDFSIPAEVVNEPIILVCGCGSREHQIVAEYDNELNQVFIHIHLTKSGFWTRLKYAFKYLFGYQCKYGAFEEIILDKKKVEKVLKLFP